VKTAVVQLTLGDDLHAKLTNIAARTGFSVHDVAEEVLQTFLNSGRIAELVAAIDSDTEYIAFREWVAGGAS
jgi:hypothetical protein